MLADHAQDQKMAAASSIKLSDAGWAAFTELTKYARFIRPKVLRDGDCNAGPPGWERRGFGVDPPGYPQEAEPVDMHTLQRPAVPCVATLPPMSGTAA